MNNGSPRVGEIDMTVVACQSHSSDMTTSLDSSRARYCEHPIGRWARMRTRC
jgi:hypothetical protein